MTCYSIPGYEVTRRARRHAGEAIVSPNATTITKPKPVTVRERVFASEKVM
jgi:hypothetical protein